MQIILISGAYQSGKDTFANMLANIAIDHGKQPMRIAFADWVKDSAKRYYSYNGAKDEAGRTFMQTYATDTVRSIDPTYWAEVVARLINATATDFDVAIISDFRFPNEADVVATFNPTSNITTVHIERAMNDEARRHHISENSLHTYAFDYIVENNSTLEELQESATALAEALDF